MFQQNDPDYNDIMRQHRENAQKERIRLKKNTKIYPSQLPGLGKSGGHNKGKNQPKVKD